jgi:hypothetical protein
MNIDLNSMWVLKREKEDRGEGWIVVVVDVASMTATVPQAKERRNLSRGWIVSQSGTDL